MMSATPESSPIRGTTIMDLTPKTKIRQLLASLDDDSEKENEQAVPRLASKPSEGVASEDETDEDVVRKPARSTTSLVARLAAEGRNDSVSSESEAEGNAYERVKKQLSMSEQAENTTKVASNASESDDIPTGARTSTRRRMTGPARSLSPIAPSSPGLFISPEKPRSSSHAPGQDSDSDTLPNGNRLAELVAKKRAERLAREQAEEELRQARSSSPVIGLSSTTKKKKTRRAVEVESETDEDKDIANKLTSSARPTRKAGKKALEEMHRETQRMSRNMQLTHEAKTKVKFTTNDLFKKFNFRQTTAPAETQPQLSISSPMPGIADTEKPHQALATPPSSPPIARSPKITVTQSSPLPAVPAAIDSDDEELPDLKSALSNAVEKATQARKALSSPARKTKQAIKPAKPHTVVEQDDDDDLEIVGEPKPSKFAIFDLIKPSKIRSSGSSNVVRALAQSNNTRKSTRKGQPSMTTAELQITLQRRAREQAQRDREEKIQRLREKGVYVQTAEEKIKEQMQIEDMLERARREADELAQREKEAAKKEGREVDGAMPDSDDDSDYDGEEPEADVDMSGSSGDEDGEDDVEADEDENEEMADAEGAGGLVDEAAEEDGDSEVDIAEEELGIVTDDSLQRHVVRRPRKNVIDSDDEDEGDGGIVFPAPTATPARPPPANTTPKSALADAFGFAQPQAAAGDLSHMFIGTMAESQVSGAGDTQAFDTQQDSLAFLRGLPQPTMPDFGAVFADDSQDVLVANSQADQSQNLASQSQPGLFRFETQTQMPYTESQASQIPEPTQDVGFQHFPTPVKPVPESFHTVDTQPMSIPLNLEPEVAAAEELEEEHVVKKKGRLMRRDQRAAIEEEAEARVAAPEQEDEDDTDPTNAFLIMRKAADKPAVPAYNKKNSEARAMIEEQAEESEDEYAGLGGNSDDEDGDFDEETKKIIDDESNEKMNERAMAKFHADKERDEDEKRVSKLFKDIANGGLRRKRGAEMELWDSDDEDEAAARRRAAKQREFAKMRKALLADEALGKIAENPKQQAFLAAIEDRDEEDDIDLLDAQEVSQPTYSQIEIDSQSQQNTAPLQPDVATVDTGELAAARPAAHLRRTKAPKPHSLAAIRNTLSELIGEDSVLDAEAEEEDLLDEEEADAIADINDDTMDVDDDSLAMDRSELMPPPGPLVNATRTAAIDRIAARRAANTSRVASTTAAKTAFESQTVSTIPSFFRKPSLLRRATTAGSNNSISDAGGGARGGLTMGENVKQGGTKKSSVNYYVREKEKMARVESIENERKEGRARVGKMRRQGLVGEKGKTGIGGLVGGKFE